MKKLFFFLKCSSFVFFASLGYADPMESAPVTEQVVVPNYEGALLKMGLTLVGLIVAVIFTVFLLKRLSRARLNQHQDSIKILEKRALSPKTMLYLIEIGDKQTLIAESQLEVRALVSLDSIPDFKE